MDFLCDRCGTRYSTTQSIRGGRAYTFRCRVCGHSIVVRGPEPGARSPRERTGPAAAPARNGASGPARPASETIDAIHELINRGLQPRDPAPPPLPSPRPFPVSVIDPTELPPPRGGYIDLSLDDDPTSRVARLDLGGGGGAGAATTPAPVRALAQPRAPAPIRKPPVAPSPPAPRQSASFRPADGPNRAARSEGVTPSGALPLVSRRLSALIVPPDDGPRLTLNRRQRLATVAAVFTLVTAVGVLLGIGLAGNATARTAPLASSPPRPSGPLAFAPPPPQPEAPPRRQDAPPIPPEQAPAPERPPPPPSPPPPADRAVRRSVAEPPVERAGGARRATARPVRHEPRPRREALRAAVFRAQPPARLASAPIQRVASAGPAVAAEEEPVAPRAGYRHPVPVTPGCVERSVRLPASWTDRTPGSVILRFAVSRGGTPDLIQMQPGPDRLPGEKVEPDLAAALSAAVRSCRFSAGTDDRGRQVRMWSVMKVQFAR